MENKPTQRKKSLLSEKLGAIAFKVSKFNKALRSGGNFEEAISYSNMTEEDLTKLLTVLEIDLDTYIEKQQQIGRVKIKIAAYDLAISKKQSNTAILKTLLENLKENEVQNNSTYIIELPVKEQL